MFLHFNNDIKNGTKYDHCHIIEIHLILCITFIIFK